MLGVGVGEEEDRLLERLHLRVHLVCGNVGLEVGEVVDGTLAVGRGDDMGGVLADVEGDFGPCCLDGCDGVGQGAVLVNAFSL